MKIKENIPLRDLSTFKIGGNAKFFVEVKDKNELEETMQFVKSKKIPIFILGGGSDILVNDNGFNGLVISYKDDSFKFEEKGNEVFVTAGAGMIWDDLVKVCVEKNLQGIECLSGIPGTVGAAPIQNIGAYGQELKDCFKELLAFDVKSGNFVTFSREDCEFAYRESVFKRPKYWQKHIIVSVTLRLIDGGIPLRSYDSLKKYLEEKGVANPSIADVRYAVLEIRKTKFEDYREVPNAGSFFKNPFVNKKKLDLILLDFPDMPYFKSEENKYKLFAGWLIEQAGWKGKKIGNASVSPNHALIITNPKKKAKATEIIKLADEIIRSVDNKFKVKLEKEVQYIH